MSHFDCAIFGAGIAGTAIANALQERGKDVLLIDPYVSEEAPGPPAALVNPATGRRAKKSWRAGRCYTALKKQIDEIMQEMSRFDLISESGVLRPAINEKLEKNFRKAPDKYDWPDGWIEWLNEGEIKKKNPNIAPNNGGLNVRCGYTVYVDRYLNTYRKYLRREGVNCRYEEAHYIWQEETNQFNIKFDNGAAETAEYVVIAAGYQTPRFKEWTDLPLELVKGQIVRFEADRDLSWKHAVSAKGYTMRRGSRDLITGSTYEHNFDSLDTTDEAFQRISKKLELMLPGIAPHVHKKEQLAGVRVTTQNRLPVIGRHNTFKNLCIYTGMNSKGLLFSHHVAGILADHLIKKAPIPDELDVNRFNP